MTLIAAIAIISITATTLAEATPSNHTAASGVNAYQMCQLPSGSVDKWWYNNREGRQYGCFGPTAEPWAMLNAYQAGGTENVHWKYTDDVNDRECMENWTYYDKDGTTWLAKIKGRTTTERDSRRWCAMPVYRSGGVEGKQWDYCSCEWVR